MQILIACLLFGTFAFAEDAQEISGHNPAYGYMKNIGIPEAQRIRQAEEVASRISGGVPATHGQFPFQAGIIAEIIRGDTVLSSVCSGSLILPTRILSAAHCWFDGHNHAWRFTIILGSVRLFSGGVRIVTSEVVVHPDWSPAFVRNDVLVAYLPAPVLSATIIPVALPWLEQFESFENETAIAVGFGTTSSGVSISPSQFLNHNNVTVITNSDCALAFSIIQPTNICTGGLGGAGFCTGDSGGPLVILRDNRLLQIGVASFGSALGCQAGFPSVYARVTSFLGFIEYHMRT